MDAKNLNASSHLNLVKNAIGLAMWSPSHGSGCPTVTTVVIWIIVENSIA